MKNTISYDKKLLWQLVFGLIAMGVGMRLTGGGGVCCDLCVYPVVVCQKSHGMVVVFLIDDDCNDQF